MGTIVRTAEAFGLNSLASTEPDFDLFYSKTIDCSRGKVFHTVLHRFASGEAAIEHLQKSGHQIAVTTLRDSTIQSFVQLDDRPIAVVFGNETTGVSPEIEAKADIRIQIPMSGTVESLNVGVSASMN